MSGSIQNLQVQTATQLRSLETTIGDNLEKNIIKSVINTITTRFIYYFKRY